MSEGLFDSVIKDSISLLNEELEKLRLQRVTRDNIFLFFSEVYVGIQVEIETTESRKKILTNRFIKLSLIIQEKYSMPGFRLVCI